MKMGKGMANCTHFLEIHGFLWQASLGEIRAGLFSPVCGRDFHHSPQQTRLCPAAQQYGAILSGDPKGGSAARGLCFFRQFPWQSGSTIPATAGGNQGT
jgi:hypothetical protein